MIAVPQTVRVNLTRLGTLRKCGFGLSILNQDLGHVMNIESAISDTRAVTLKYQGRYPGWRSFAAFTPFPSLSSTMCIHPARRGWCCCYRMALKVVQSFEACASSRCPKLSLCKVIVDASSDLTRISFPTSQLSIKTLSSLL